MSYFLSSLSRLIKSSLNFLTSLLLCPSYLSISIFSFQFVSAIFFLLFRRSLFSLIFSCSTFFSFCCLPRSFWRSRFPVFFFSATVLPCLPIFYPFSMASSPVSSPGASDIPECPVRFRHFYSVQYFLLKRARVMKFCVLLRCQTIQIACPICTIIMPGILQREFVVRDGNIGEKQSVCLLYRKDKLSPVACSVVSELVSR